jgi:hypothetical protein
MVMSNIQKLALELPTILQIFPVVLAKKIVAFQLQ